MIFRHTGARGLLAGSDYSRVFLAWLSREQHGLPPYVNSLETFYKSQRLFLYSLCAMVALRFGLLQIVGLMSVRGRFLVVFLFVLVAKQQQTPFHYATYPKVARILFRSFMVAVLWNSTPSSVQPQMPVTQVFVNI